MGLFCRHQLHAQTCCSLFVTLCTFMVAPRGEFLLPCFRNVQTGPARVSALDLQLWSPALLMHPVSTAWTCHDGSYPRTNYCRGLKEANRNLEWGEGEQRQPRRRLGLGARLQVCVAPWSYVSTVKAPCCLETSIPLACMG